jgi:hypothetical protein
MSLSRTLENGSLIHETYPTDSGTERHDDGDDDRRILGIYTIYIFLLADRCTILETNASNKAIQLGVHFME